MKSTNPSTLIEFGEQEDDLERIILAPNEEGDFIGFGKITLNHGSFEMRRRLTHDPLEIKEGFINCSMISICAGERGCDITISRPTVQKKF